MSFQTIQFSYTPPPTVDQAPLDASAAQPAPVAMSQSAVNLAAAQTNAGQLLDQIAGLQGINNYLQQMLLSLCQGQSISLNFNGNAELAASLQRLYTSTSPPPGISVDMYSNLLDTEMGVMQTEMVLQNSNSSLLVSPVQKADLQRATSTFEDAMGAAGTFQTQLPLLLRNLKTDQVILSSMATGLSKYPVLNGSSYQPAASTATPSVISYVNTPVSASSPVAGLPPLAAASSAVASGSSVNVAAQQQQQSLASIDMSPQLKADMGAHLNAMGQYYASMYNVATGIDKVYSDISNITNTYINQPLQKLVSIVSMLSSLKMLFHKPTLNELKGCLANLVLGKLVSELGLFTMLMDRMQQKLIAPVMQVLTEMNKTMAQVASTADEVAYLTAQGGFSGILSGAASGSHSLPAPQRIAELDKLSGMTKSLGVQLASGVNKMNQKVSTVETSMIASLARKMQANNDQLTVMQDLRGIDASVGIFQSLILQSQGKAGLAGVLTNPTPLSPAAQGTAGTALSQVIGNLKSGGSANSFSLQANTLVITPPNVPAPSSGTASLMSGYGANLVTAASITQVHI